MWPGEKTLSEQLDISLLGRVQKDATKPQKIQKFKRGAKYFQKKEDLFHRCQGGLSHSPELTMNEEDVGNGNTMMAKLKDGKKKVVVG